MIVMLSSLNIFLKFGYPSPKKHLITLNQPQNCVMGIRISAHFTLLGLGAVVKAAEKIKFIPLRNFANTVIRFHFDRTISLVNINDDEKQTSHHQFKLF